MRAQLLFDDLILFNDSITCNSSGSNQETFLQDLVLSDGEVVTSERQKPEDHSIFSANMTIGFDNFFQKRMNESIRGLKRKQPSSCHQDKDEKLVTATKSLPKVPLKKSRSDSVDSNDSSTFYNPSNRRKSTLSVSFNPAVRVDFVDTTLYKGENSAYEHTVPTTTSTDIDSSKVVQKYYHREEIKQMKNEARNMCKTLRKTRLDGGEKNLRGKEFEGESFRGLEQFCCTSSAKERLVQKKLSILAVIKEQRKIQRRSASSPRSLHEQKSEEESSQMFSRLAKVYAPLTKDAMDYSLHLASQDEVEAEVIQKES